MNCSKCGTFNDDTAKFCSSCGSQLLTPEQTTPPMAPPVTPYTGQTATPPPMATPGQMAPPPNMSYGAAPQPASKPYKAEFIMGLIGSIVGVIIFLVVFISSLAWGGLTYGFGYGYGAGIVAAGIIGSIFILVSFILGFVGTSQLNKGNGKGGVLLTVAGGLGFIAMFIAILSAGWSGLFFYPLLLTAGIMALVRRKKVESGIY